MSSHTPGPSPRERSSQAVLSFLAHRRRSPSASELTTARSRLQTYSSLPKSNDLVSRLATSAARKYHLRTFGTRSIEGRVHDATVEPLAQPTRQQQPTQTYREEESIMSRAGSLQASPLLGADRNPPPSAPPLMSPILLPNAQPPIPPPLEDDPASSSYFQPSTTTDPTSPSYHPPPPPPSAHTVPPVAQPQRLFAQFSTNTINPPTSIFPAPYPSSAPPPIHTFTRSIIDVLGSWANQHPDILGDPGMSEMERRELVDGWVTTVGPFVGCLKLEAGVYWGWGEWRSKMGEFQSCASF